jgi:hypothetical protein
VHTGLFGTNESFVPLQGARVQRGVITLGYDKQRIKNAPNAAHDRNLSPDEERYLYRYYGIGGYDRSGVPDGGSRGRMPQRLVAATPATTPLPVSQARFDDRTGRL